MEDAMASTRATTSSGWHGRGRAADQPSDIPKQGWKDILLRVKSQIKEDHASIVAAGVTFYGFLAIFPAIAAVVSIYGIFVDPATVEQHLNQLTAVLPPQAHELLSQQLKTLAGKSGSTLGLGLAISIFLAIWSAKKGASALIEGMNIAYDEDDERGFFKKTAVSLAFTFGAILLAIICAVLVVALPAALGNLGLSGPVALALRIARWVLLAVILGTALALIYRYAPDRDHAKWRWVTWGSAVAVVLWLLASWAFSYYVSNFGSYNKTYGSLAAVVILLMWLFISSYIVLLGAEINSEMEHQTEKDSTTGPEKPIGERGAHHADTVGKSR
jgi:membrane protein